MIRDNKAKTFLVSAPIAHRQLKYFSYHIPVFGLL